MPILGAVIAPHPPLIIPTVGRGREREVQATIDAYRTAAKQVAAWEPEALIITSPHQIMYTDYFHISPGRSAAGDMSTFGAPETRLTIRYDEGLREELVRRAESAGLRAGTLGERDPFLDHGTFLPLYFLREAGVDCPILRVGLSGFSPLDHYRLGQCITQAVETLGRKAVFIASGDLSHKLREDGPYGFAPEGPEFDCQITEAMAAGDFLRFLTMDPTLCDRAAECGLRSFQIMAGALDGLAVEAELLSYEGVTGVGYGVATFTVTGPNENRRFGEQCAELEQVRLAEKKVSEDPWVKLARLSLETYVKTGKRLERLPEGLPAEMTDRAAGAFVSLHAHGRLRGCIGTTGPTTGSVAWEIVQNAVSACSRDPRFIPVGVEELDSLEYGVDVLGQPEPISSPAELDVKKYGVIVSCGGRRGLLLPDLEGVDTVEQQIDIARQKGGISSREKYTLERFEVVRHL
ncbi:AmmeMemoRadiSam system protein A [uncultured Oscillibacter sp.]|uniref:AmmeMemoRadiSam system protein A n=1 Tax=uncultured Oscillibacter sp. TaxID=876091 RepID=UPI0026021594|nr:AmmeMemoRadiSam system protein A [uncultured Oscillibacter sp.]